MEKLSGFQSEKPTWDEIKERVFSTEDATEFLKYADIYDELPLDDPIIQEARRFAIENTTDHAHPTGSVIMIGGEMIGRGANHSQYHEQNGCERKDKITGKSLYPSGEGYDKCPGCASSYHSEPQAIADAIANLAAEGRDQSELQYAELVLWGHWWCCQDCWKAALSSGIKKISLVENRHELFDRPRGTEHAPEEVN